MPSRVATSGTVSSLVSSHPLSSPSVQQLPSGCSFHPRCPYVTAECKTIDPGLEIVGRGHAAACIHHDRVRLQRDVVAEVAP